MKLHSFITKINRIKTAFTSPENAEIVLKFGSGEYPIEYVLLNENSDKCILKIDDLAEIDIVHKIIKYGKDNGNGSE